jgi:hypothetical protein
MSSCRFTGAIYNFVPVYWPQLHTAEAIYDNVLQRDEREVDINSHPKVRLYPYFVLILIFCFCCMSLLLDSRCNQTRSILLLCYSSLACCGILLHSLKLVGIETLSTQLKFQHLIFIGNSRQLHHPSVVCHHANAN